MNDAASLNGPKRLVNDTKLAIELAPSLLYTPGLLASAQPNPQLVMPACTHPFPPGPGTTRGPPLSPLHVSCPPPSGPAHSMLEAKNVRSDPRLAGYFDAQVASDWIGTCACRRCVG